MKINYICEKFIQKSKLSCALTHVMYFEIIERFFYLTAKLDGVSSQAIKRMADAHHSSINEWLEIDSADTKDTGKKRVCYKRIIIVFFYNMTN